MIKGIHITIENKEVLDDLFATAMALGSTQATEALPNTANALFKAAQTIETAWKDWAMGGQISGVENIPHPNPKVAASIHTTPNEAKLSNYEITSEHPAMADYVNGKDETIDMKAQNPWGDERSNPWLTGKESRVNKKDGSPYLIVPFSWTTTGKVGGSSQFRNIVPKGIQEALKKQNISKVLGKLHTEPNVKGEEIPRNDYNWGGRISKKDVERRNLDDLTRSRIVGLVRMWDSAYKDRTVGNYFTFRVISPKAAADKWIQHRHIKPHDVTGALARKFEQMIQDNVNAALFRDFGGDN